MILETSASESGEKEGRLCVFAVKLCSSVCGVENWRLMVVLFMKTVTKSSAVTVDEGGGGQRREEKVLKCVRVRIVHFDVLVCCFSSEDISREGREE